MMRYLWTVLVVGLVALPSWADLTVVENGRSDYSIYYEVTSPRHRPAATELQRLIEAATGVKLPIVTQPAEPMIAVGDSAAVREAGFAPDQLPVEGFRIVTREPNLYIFGHDTPPGEKTAQGGVSEGTAFGVYSFAERVLGVRWLMPGEVGEDVPHHDALRVPAMDVTDAPAMSSRTVNYVHDRRREVQAWKRHLKLGGSLKIDHGHAWDAHPPRRVLLEHPEYMAELGGVRVKPEATRSGMHTYKFCTTNPGLIDAFADSIADTFDKDPDRYSLSLSPSDGHGWCECAACTAAIERHTDGPWGDFGGYDYSRTAVMLEFFNAVARRVAERHPDRMLGAYVYASYTYPPASPIPLEPNLFIVLASRPYYGMTLYKPAYEAEFKRLIDHWSQSAPNLGYYALDTWMRNYTGAPVGPSLPILKTTFPTLEKHGVKLMNYTAFEAWGYAGLHNYLIAKLMWDPGADIDALYDEYLSRAYGPGAEAMDKLYTLLDELLAEYELTTSDFNYEMTSEILMRVYVENFDRLEALYREAMANVATDAQRKRLAMFGDNMVILHAILRRGGVLENLEQSIFYRTDEQLAEFREANKDSLALVYSPTADYGKKYGGLTRLFIPEQRELKVQHVSAGAAPTIDGDLSDAAWQDADVASGFRLPGSVTKAKAETHVRAVYDDQRLYLAIHCEEPTGEPRRETTQRDSLAIYNDDVAELFFAPTGDFRNHYWHLAINAANAQWDALVDNAKYDLDWTSAVQRSGEGWTVEIAIPFESLNLKQPPAGQTWRANLTRTDTPGHETSSWNAVEERFMEPNNFGAWKFVAP